MYIYIIIYRYIMSMYIEATSLKPGLICSRGSNMLAAPVHMPVMTIKGQCPTKEAAQARLKCRKSGILMGHDTMTIYGYINKLYVRNTHKHVYIYIYMHMYKSIINYIFIQLHTCIHNKIS